MTIPCAALIGPIPGLVGQRWGEVVDELLKRGPIGRRYSSGPRAAGRADELNALRSSGLGELLGELLQIDPSRHRPNRVGPDRPFPGHARSVRTGYALSLTGPVMAGAWLAAVAEPPDQS